MVVVQRKKDAFNKRTPMDPRGERPKATRRGEGPRALGGREHDKRPCAPTKHSERDASGFLAWEARVNS